MTFALAVLFGIVFLEVFVLLDIRRDVMRILAESRGALATLRSAASDDDKEVAMRGASVRMFAGTGMLILKFLGVAAALAALYFLIITVVPSRREALEASLVSPLGIAVITVATLVYAWGRNAVLKKL